MKEEVESNALYELSATLARSTGSHKLPKLKPLLSSLSGLSLPRQQTMQLLQTLSLAPSTLQPHDAQLGLMVPNVGSRASLSPQPTLHATAAAAMQMNVSYSHQGLYRTSLSDGRQQQATGATYQDCHHGNSSPAFTDVLSREAMLLFGHSKYPATPEEAQRETVMHTQPKPAEDKALAQLMEAVLYEEKYHRAGREVLGQRIDTKATEVQQAERAKQRRKHQIQKLGYVPLRAVPSTAVRPALAAERWLDRDSC